MDNLLCDGQLQGWGSPFKRKLFRPCRTLDLNNLILFWNQIYLEVEMSIADCPDTKCFCCSILAIILVPMQEQKIVNTIPDAQLTDLLWFQSGRIRILSFELVLILNLWTVRVKYWITLPLIWHLDFYQAWLPGSKSIIVISI